MTKIEITRTELVWPGKYDEDDNPPLVKRFHLPFQVNEPPAAGGQPAAFDSLLFLG